MSVSLDNRIAVPRLRNDAGLLSTIALASGGGLQTESVDDADAAVSDLWVGGLYQKRHYRTAATASFHTYVLSLGMDCSDYFLLDFPQHTLVSVCFLMLQPSFRGGLPPAAHTILFLV